ncbi:MAG TPA: Ig domain-containing protein, partial [Nannocystis sp.]
MTMTFAGEGRTWWTRVCGSGLKGALVVVAAAPLPSCGDDDAAGVGSSYGSATQTTGTTTTDTTATTSATDSASTTIDDPTTTTGPEPTTTEEPEPPPLQVECGTPPMGAQGANYAHEPSASGGKPGYMWSAVGLPEGLTIHPSSGAISGVPTTPGEYMVELTVTDVAAATAMTSCAITINDALTVDYDALAADGPCVTAGGKTILDYISGGDGSPITCSTPGGSGNGKIPTGLSVDPESCEITGSVAETRYGSWSWIVAAEQSGVTVYAPYCAVQPLQAPMAYA